MLELNVRVTGFLAAGGIGPYWRFIGVFHPAATHFPIALLMVAALVEAWSVLRRQRRPLHATLVCLYLGAAAAVVATVLGWANADASPRHGTVITIHRWVGVSVAVLSVISVFLSVRANRIGASGGTLWAYRAAVFLSAALVGLAGSYGGKLSFGTDYYSDAFAAMQHELRQGVSNVTGAAVSGTKNAVDAAVGTISKTGDAIAGRATAQPTRVQVSGPTTKQTAVPEVAGDVDFARDVQPIFEARCVKCHNESKQKGDYRLDTHAHLMKPGESGKSPIVAGKSGESHLVNLIEGQGEFEDSVMPPKGEKLNDKQVALIRRWIDEGAKPSAQ
jgi:uncharacterized membrane protein